MTITNEPISKAKGVCSGLETQKTFEHDATIMALRLLGEDEDTFSPECREVMERWKPKALKTIAGAGVSPSSQDSQTVSPEQGD